MYANRGMYVEEIINRTISYLQNQNCIIEKRNIPIKIIKKVNGNKVLGILLDKSTVDYCGFVNNQHIEFEAKQTNQANFNVKLLQPHQYEFLLKAKSIGAVAFVIVHFTMYDEFYLLPIE
jgi:recombination protein U